MKKIFIFSFSAILIAFHPADAQITKGALFLGGNISFTSSNNGADNNSINYKQTAFVITPVIGKVVRENLVVGAGLTYTYTKYRQGPTNVPNDQIANGYGANIFVRKYKSIGKGFYIYLEGSAGGSYSKSDNKPLTAYNNYKRTSFGLGLAPGISYAVTKKLQLELGLSQVLSIAYNHEKGDKLYGDNIPYTNNIFVFNTSLTNSYLSNVYFGFRLLLPK